MDSKKREIYKVDWMKEHTLTPEQFKKLVLNKFARASEYQAAMLKREVLCGYR